MKINKRLHKRSNDLVEKAVKAFVDAHNKENIFSKAALTSEVSDEAGNLAQTVIIEVANRIEDFAEIISNNGFDVNKQKNITLADLDNEIAALRNEKIGELSLSQDNSMSSLGFLISQTITRLVTKVEFDSLEAWQMVSKDLQMEEGQVIYQVVLGLMGHGAGRIPEGGEYKTFSLSSTEENIKTSSGKVGVYATYSEEAARRAGMQAIKLITEAAVADISRFKTFEAISLLEANAKTVLDGLDPTKMPSGRSFKKPEVANGTLLMRDLENFFCKAQMNGHDVDVVFIHPLAYSIFYKEPAIKEWMKETANVQFLVPKKKQTIYHNLITKLTKTTTGTAQAAKGVEINVPNLLTGKTFNIVVTPMVKYHGTVGPIFEPTTRYTENPKPQYTETRPYPCTDILLIDSERALSYVHDGRGIICDKVEDRMRDLTKIKFKTYYSFILDKDHGVYAFRNISITDDVYNPYKNPVHVINHSDVFPSEKVGA